MLKERPRVSITPLDPLTIRRPCAVCSLSMRMPVAAPKLCEHCRKDLSATRRRVIDAVDAAERHAEQALECWEANIAHADPTTQGRYQRFRLAQADPGQASTVQRVVAQALAQKEHPNDVALATLIRGQLAYADATQQWMERRTWADRAWIEIEDADDLIEQEA